MRHVLIVLISLMLTACGEPPAGIPGPKGDTGKTGAQGPTGSQGSQGVQGVPGDISFPCTVRTDPAGARIVCPDATSVVITNGVNGVDGQPGVPGIDGINGTNGTNGENGAPGTQIVPTQFCVNSGATVYPSNFPEFGLCIDGKMYGVYSANNGFLALLPDGTYSSNPVGPQCTFVIAGCTVTQQ